MANTERLTIESSAWWTSVSHTISKLHPGISITNPPHSCNLTFATFPQANCPTFLLTKKPACSSCTDIYHSDLFSWSRSVSRNPSVRSGRADFQISLGGFRSGCGRTEFEHTKAHLNFPGQDVHRVHFNPRGHPDELWSSEMAPSGGARNERRGKRYTRMVV